MGEKQHISVFAKLWTDRNGNTHHQVSVWVNGNFVGREVDYGYGGAYLQTATEMLIQKGVIPESAKKHTLPYFVRQHKDSFTLAHAYAYVATKKDMLSWT